MLSINRSSVCVFSFDIRDFVKVQETSYIFSFTLRGLKYIIQIQIFGLLLQMVLRGLFILVFATPNSEGGLRYCVTLAYRKGENIDDGKENKYHYSIQGNGKVV